MGFEPTRAEHIGLAVQRLNHSATSSVDALLTNAVTSFFYLSFIPCLGILRAVGRNFADRALAPSKHGSMSPQTVKIWSQILCLVSEYQKIHIYINS